MRMRILGATALLLAACVGQVSDTGDGRTDLDLDEVGSPIVNTRLVMPAPVEPPNPATTPAEPSNPNGVNGRRPARTFPVHAP